MSINIHVNLQIAVGGTATATAKFGVPMFVVEHAITAARQNGPYSSQAAAAADGFTLAAAPEVYAWAGAWQAQRPRSSQFMIGRRDAGDASIVASLDAIYADAPASWYATLLDSRADDDIMAAATWMESKPKILVAQTDSAEALAGTASTAQVEEITVGGTATDGVYSIEVINNWTGASLATATVTRAGGVPATNDDIAAALKTAWDGDPILSAIASTVGVVGAVITITFDGLGNSYSLVLSAPAPGTLTDTGGTAPTQNIGELTQAAAFDRTALIYHDDDTEYLDAAWVSRCLGFNLDAPGGAGSWAYQRVSGVPGSPLTDPQRSNLLGYGMNYNATVTYTSGVDEAAFVFPGTAASGQFIDIQTTVDLTQARLEEAILGVFLSAAASSRPKIPYTDAGLARIQAAAEDVLNRLVRAGHYSSGSVSETTGRVTPWVDVPSAASVSSAVKQTRVITMQAEAVFAGAINSVGDQATVGFTVDLVFG